MAVVYDIEHITTYRYKKPVTMAQHRAMFLPRSGYAGRIYNYSISTSVPSKIQWIMDALSNSVALIDFIEPATELSISFKFRGAHYGAMGVEEFALDPRGRVFPVQYTPDEWMDLAAFLRPHAEDPDGSVAAWGRGFLAAGTNETAQVLKRLMDEIRDTFKYQTREAEGTQAPAETLKTKSGTCRDFAWLMIETLRGLGLACRFMSGYLYDASLDGGSIAMTGSASTHAWLAVYLPGAGWLHYDPTNRISAGFALIPVAIARHPSQAIPLQGSWFGSAADYVGMDVNVSIRKVADIVAAADSHTAPRLP
jgi:transglutaminase-like putative cysteine protease